MTPIPDAFNKSLVENNTHFEEETTVNGTAAEVYRREGETAWNSVGDGRLAAEVRLTQIPDAFNKSLLENKKHFEEEKTVEEVGIICLSANNLEKIFIAFNDTEAGWCDKTWHCQLGGVLEIHLSSPSPSSLLSLFSPLSSSFVISILDDDNNQQQTW